jgi:hypothetical protein
LAARCDPSSLVGAIRFDCQCDPPSFVGAIAVAGRRETVAAVEAGFRV